jgi:phosphosulfolactate synthase
MSSPVTFQEFLGIEYPPRSSKPRKKGITMVMDTGWPVSFVESMLDQYGEFLDVVKIWDPHLRAPEAEVRKKIDVYNAHKVRVQPGGIFLEIARHQGKEREVLERISQMGFSIIEVSSSATTRRAMTEEADFVRQVTDMGFAVFGEVGKKFFTGDETRTSEEILDEEATIDEMSTLIEAGAELVYWEGHVLRRVMGESGDEILAKRATGTEQVLRVANAVGADRIIFEVSALVPWVSRRSLQFWLISLFGTEVNLGNGRLEELGHIEALRAGSHPVFGFEDAGDYPWIRALAEQKGPEHKWWAEAVTSDGV